MKKIIIDDDFTITKIGNDSNGNYSYSVSKDGNRAKKVQHTNIGNHNEEKITRDSMKEYNNNDKFYVDRINKTFNEIKKYYNEFCEINNDTELGM